MSGQIIGIVYCSFGGWKVLGPSPKELVWTGSQPQVRRERVLGKGGKSSEIIDIIWAKVLKYISFGQNLRYDPFWLCSSGLKFLCSVYLKTLFCPRCQGNESTNISLNGPAQAHLECFLARCNKAAVL